VDRTKAAGRVDDPSDLCDNRADCDDPEVWSGKGEAAPIVACVRSWLLSLWIAAGLAAGAGGRTVAIEGGDPVRFAGRVVSERVDFEDAPDGEGFVAGTLEQNERVTVLGRTRSGWLVIEPPAGAFCWVDEASLRDVEGQPGMAIVAADETAVRTGRAAARMPGPPRGRLAQGDLVECVDRPTLRVGDGATARSWRAIVPPAGIRFYLPSHGVELLRGPSVAGERSETTSPIRANRPASRAEARSAAGAARKPVAASRPQLAEPEGPALPVPEDLAFVGPRIGEGVLTADLATRLRDIESEHRAVLRRAMVDWDLSLVRSRYQSLLTAASSPEAQAALRGRIGQVARQQTAAEAARALQDVLARMPAPGASPLPSTDQEGGPARAEAPPVYEAQGLLQPSSKLVRGQRVYALIGHEGYAAAYLLIPTGLPADEWVGRQVGVHGSSQYDDTLRAKVIDVFDMVALSRAP
jgi:hypothetical protein